MRWRRAKELNEDDVCVSAQLLLKVWNENDNMSKRQVSDVLTCMKGMSKEQQEHGKKADS